MKYNILILLLTALFLGACDYLEYDEKSYLLQDDIYSDLGRTKSALTGVYTYLPSEFTQIGDAMLASACDEAFFANDAASVHKYFNGAWSSSQVLDSKWGYYSAIRAANLFLTEVEKYVYEDHLYDKDPTYAELMVELNRFKYEARALRAFFYFELAKRYGDVPLTEEVLTEEEANSITRTPFKDVIAYIVKECDAAAANLPLNYDNERGKETGRITKGAAMAIKAKALLYAASPLHNSSNSVDAWKLAANAAADIISLKAYSLNSNYETTFNNYASSNKELIWERRNGTSNNFERINFPIGFVGGKSGNCPTQNLVDAYEMKQTGLGINEAGSGYNPASPYAGRDPRLAATVLFNGSTWKGETVETFTGGKNGAPQRYASPTGYYLKKYVIESINLQEPNVTQKEHTWVLFRYAEVLLNYAEAMNEAYGPQDANGNSLTALQAVNQVRARAGMPAFPASLTKDQFRTKLRNERMVELAFECHRFWDIRRWKIADQTNTIKGVVVTSTGNGFSYQNQVVANRNFDNKMYLYPIPFDENILNPNLGQNPGW